MKQRSSGHLHDSNQGTMTAWAHLPCGEAIIVAVANYMITCYACKLYRKTHGLGADGIVPPEYKLKHCCKENHCDLVTNAPRSPKSMEAQGVVDMALLLLRHGLWMRFIVMDDDSSVPAKMCPGHLCAMPPGLETEKILGDPSHRLRSFAGELFKIAGGGRLEGEVQGDSQMTQLVALKMKKYLHGITYLYRERGLADGLWLEARRLYKAHLWQSLEHAFGRHSALQSKMNTACRMFFKCPACPECGGTPDYVPQFYHNLVGVRGSQGYRYLRGTAIYAKMEEVFEKYTTEDKLNEIIHPFSSQCNESRHVAYRAKMPKDRDYGHSASGSRWVAAAVGELTVGAAAYHKRVFESMGMGSTLRDNMQWQHEVKRIHKGLHQKKQLHKDQRVSNRRYKAAETTAAERVDAMKGFRYDHGMNVSSAAGGSIPQPTVTIHPPTKPIEPDSPRVATTQVSPPPAAAAATADSAPTGRQAAGSTWRRSTRSSIRRK